MIMTVSLVIVLGLVVILVGHLKIGEGIENSARAFYAARAGLERILYEDKLCRQPGCAGHCIPGCDPATGGLATSTSFSGTLLNQATYEAKFHGAGYFESIGTFERARRTISYTR